MTRIRRIAVACGCVVAAVPMGGAFAAPASLDPVPLFKAFCTEGGSHLPSRYVTAQNYRRLPIDAREVLSMGAPNPERRADALFSPLPVREVPNDVYRIGGDGETYLILAKPEARGIMANSCAVVWRGSQFAEARRAVNEIVGMPPDTTTDDSGSNEGINAFGVNGKGFAVKAAEVDGWTMLRATPEPNTASR